MPNSTVLTSRAGVSGLWAAILFVGLSSSTNFVFAQDAFSIVVGGGIRHDDNIRRLRSDADAEALTGTSTRSDQIHFVSLALRYDQSFSQQRFLVSAGITDNRYRTFDELDYQAKNYSAAWQWYATSNFTGRILADRSQTQADFRDYQGTVSRNIVTTENRRVEADWWILGAWHLIGGVLENRQTYSLQTQTATATNYLRSAEMGIRYLAETGDSLTLLRRQGKGEYPDRSIDLLNLFDDRFAQDETEGAFVYRTSGKSSLSGRVARVTREHDNVPLRDYSGTIGMLEWQWNPTVQLEFRLGGNRDMASFQDGNSSYYVNDRLYIAPTWVMSEKTSLGLRYDESQRRYKGAVTVGTAVRKDEVKATSINLTWLPSAAISVVASFQRESLTSNVALFGYTANVISLTLAGRF